MADLENRNPLQPGYELLWYRIDRILGHGEFGSTYLAFDLNLRAPVAIKEYLPSGLCVRGDDGAVLPFPEQQDEGYRRGLERFIGEARALARLHHRNIVRVLSVFERSNTAYMVMEHEQGDSLAQILQARRSLPEKAVRRLLLPLLDGLRQVHDAGLIHGDINPANILLRRDGSPVLLDFGTARQATAGDSRSVTSVLSPGYAAPEQYFSQDQRQGPWTDIYALAATLYHAAVGRPPIDAIGRSEAKLRGKADGLISAEKLGQGRYSPAFLRGIDAGMRFMEGQRPQSVAQWLAYFSADEDAATPAHPFRPRPDEDRAGFEFPAGVSAAAEHCRSAEPAPPAARQGRRAGRRVSAVAAAAALVLLGAWAYHEPLMQWAADALGRHPAEASREPTVAAPSGEGNRVQSGQAETAHQRPQKRRDAAVVPPQQTQQQPKQTVAATQAAATKQGAEQARKLAGQRDAAKQAAKDNAAAEKKAQARQARIDGLLRAARSELQRGHLSGKGKDNALARFRAVLALDPGNRKAQKGVAEVLDHYLAEVGREARAGTIAGAESALAHAAAIDPQAKGLAHAHAQIRAAKARLKRTAKVNELLALARQDLTNGQIYEPPGENAIERYRQVQALEPHNVAVKRGFIDIANKLMSMANKASYDGHYKAAYHYLDIAAALFPKREEIKSARHFVDLRKESRAQAAARKRNLEEAEQRLESERRASDQKTLPSGGTGPYAAP